MCQFSVHCIGQASDPQRIGVHAGLFGGRHEKTELAVLEPLALTPSALLSPPGATAASSTLVEPDVLEAPQPPGPGQPAVKPRRKHCKRPQLAQPQTAPRSTPPPASLPVPAAPSAPRCQLQPAGLSFPSRRSL